MSLNRLSHLLRKTRQPSRAASTDNFRLGLALALIVANLIAFSLGINMLMQTREYLHDRVEISTRNLVDLLDQSIIEKSRVFDDTVGRVAQELQTQLAEGGRDDARLNRFLQIQLNQLPEVYAIHVTDEAGFVRWGRDVNPDKPANAADRDYFKQHRASQESRLIVSPPILGRVSQRWVISFTRPYRHPDGRFSGVIMVSASVSGFSDMLARADTGKSGTVVLRHANLGLIARHPPIEGPAGLPGNNKVSPEFTHLIESGTNAAFFQTPRSPDGIERTYAFRRLTHLPFILAVGMARDEYLAPWREDVIRVSLLLGAFLAMTLAAAWLILRYWQIRQTAEQALQRSEDNLRRAQAVAGLGSWHLDISQDRLTWSDETYAIFGVARGTPMTLERFVAFVHPADVQQVNEAWAAALQGNTYEIEHRIVVDGHTRWVHERAQVDLAADGTPHTAIGTVQDITERKHIEEQIRNQAFYDSLTNLPNRRLLDERLAMALAGSKRSGQHGAVMMLDLDNFKPLNDAHGHAVGDQLLIEVSQRLSACVREVDTVARLGGDEFVIVLIDLGVDAKTSREAALRVAEKIRNALAEPYFLASTPDNPTSQTIEHHCSSSIGVALFLGQNLSQHQIIKQADMAMYQAKESGRNTVCCAELTM